MDQIRRDLQMAFYLELFAEFSFVVGLLAIQGAFNGGQPTTTPRLAVAYFLAGFFVTIAVIGRTRQMLAAADRADMDELRRMRVGIWAVIAFFFSLVLPAIYLQSAARRLRVP